MALPNGDLITTVFDPQMAYPVDKRMQVDTLNSRDSISMYIRWEGMTVYVLEDSKIYILQGGRSNEFWKELGLGSGTGGTTFVGQFESADLLPTTGRSAGDYAFVGTGEDFVQYNWDNIANEWVMAEGQTDMASEHFHIGYKTPLRRPVIFRRDPKDVIIDDSGDIIIDTQEEAANFILTGEVTSVRGIISATDGREIHLTNRTGSDVLLVDEYTSTDPENRLNLGGSDYTLSNGETVAPKSESDRWVLGPVNEVAFSDHLDSVGAIRSVGPDGLEVVSGILGFYSKKEETYKEVTQHEDGSPMTDAKVDGVFYKKFGNKFLLSTDVFDGVVNVKKFGAVGNAYYVNKNAESPTFGQAFQDADFTIPAHDDTEAFKRAVDFILNYARSILNREGTTNSGHRSKRLKLYIPDGAFYLTEPNVFFRREGVSEYTQAGYLIEGNGVQNSYLIYYNPTDEGEFLFNDQNQFPDMGFRDFAVHCNTGNENIFLQHSTGNSQNYEFYNVKLKDYKRAFKITGTGNADKILFSKVQARSYADDNCFFEIDGNSQAIGHTFLGCNMVAGNNGILIKLNTGGIINISGGSWIVVDQATMYHVTDSGGMIPTHVSLTTYSTKIEIHNDAVWVYNMSSHVIINNEKTRFIGNDNNNHKIIVGDKAKVILEKVTFQDQIKAALIGTNNSWSTTKAELILSKCSFSSDFLLDGWVDHFSDFESKTPFSSTNDSGIGRVLLLECTKNGSTIRDFIDGSPYAHRANHNRTYTKKIAIVASRGISSLSLPRTTDTSGIATLPLNCIVCRVGIRKNSSSPSGAQNVQIWHAKDGNGNILVSLTTANRTDELTVFSPDLYYITDSEELREVHLVADESNSNHNASGYMIVEYI